MIAACKAFLLEMGAQWGISQAGEWTFLFHNNYHPHCSGINILWFRGDEFPQVVTKIYRDPDILSREFRNLQQVHARVPDLVPRPLHFGRLAGFWTLWMSGVPGSRFPVTGKHSPKTLHSIVQALISLHDASRMRDSQHADRYRQTISEPLHSVCNFANSPSLRQSCEAFADRVPPDWMAALPVIPQHGDFFPGNLLRDGKRWYIVDWESFGFVDLPLYDVLTFCLSLLETGAARNIPALVHSYSERFDLSRKDIALLLPLTLMNWFHLQWTDGRKEFAIRTHKVIESYFNSPESWEKMILVPSS